MRSQWAYPPPPRFDPRMFGRRPRFHRTRQTYRATRATVRFARRVHRKAWARRRPLTPLYAAVPVFVLGAVAHATPRGWASVLLLAVLAAFVVAAWQVGAHRKADRSWHRLKRPEWVWTVAVWGGCTGWLAWAAQAGVGPPRLGWFWMVLLPGAWVGAAFRYRVRPKPAEVWNDIPLLDVRVQEWVEEAACADGAAPGSTISQPLPLDDTDPELAWMTTVELPKKGRVTSTALAARVEQVAMVYDRPVSDVVIEPLAGASPRWAKLTVFTRNPLQDRVWWPGPDLTFDPETGMAQAARYATGGTAAYRFWGESGPVHDLIAGVTGSGKSAYVNSLLAIERYSPLMASVVIDPQRGQSLPRWTKQVAVYARSIDEGRDVLAGLVTEMLRRNEVLSLVRWVDEKGRQVEGVDSFDPTSLVIRALGLPLICVTIEEAAMQLLDPDSLGYVIALSTMARKCGIKLRLLFQTPLLDQVVSNVLRDQLIGGNVVVFRTGSPVSGQVVLNGVLPASPHLLPREWPDGSTASGVCYVLGPGARSVIARTWPIEDVYHWATLGDTTRLPELEYAVALARGEHAGDQPVPVAAAQHSPPTAPASYPTRIRAYLELHGLATTGTLAAALGEPGRPVLLSTISQACRRLVQRGLIVDHGHAMWGPAEVAAEVAA